MTGRSLDLEKGVKLWCPIELQRLGAALFDTLEAWPQRVTALPMRTTAGGKRPSMF